MQLRLSSPRFFPGFGYNVLSALSSFFFDSGLSMDFSSYSILSRFPPIFSDDFSYTASLLSVCLPPCPMFLSDFFSKFSVAVFAVRVYACSTGELLFRCEFSI